jgi:hypothetical protein
MDSFKPWRVTELAFEQQAENSETDSWLDIASSCFYADDQQIEKIKDLNIQIGKLIGHMLHDTDDFLHHP